VMPMPGPSLASEDRVQECKVLCRTMRRWIIEQSFASQVGHVGSCLSVVEIMSALWCGVMKSAGTAERDRDRFILSKGHAALALYCALRWKGLINEDTFHTYCANGSDLGGHPLHRLAAVELSTGSLGQGLSVACGLAYGLRHTNSPARVFVLLSDGECNEGQVWEAAMFAAHHQLTNLCVVVDHNGSQCMGRTSDVLRADLVGIWRAFGWDVGSIDGHSIEQLLVSFDGIAAFQKPRAVVADTVLGKGISFMEHRFEWHYRNLDPDLKAAALDELWRVEAQDASSAG
jgi:transketolase